jgi:Vacuolar sorting protein 9 (VPS9) domain
MALPTEREMSIHSGRRSGLLAEARRKRLTWIEEARFATLSAKDITADSNSRIKGVAQLQQACPSAAVLYALLTAFAEGRDAANVTAAALPLSTILLPYALQDAASEEHADAVHTIHEQQGAAAAAYNSLLDKLRNPAAAELVSALDQFCASFNSRAKALLANGAMSAASTAEQAEAVHAFLARVTQHMHEHQLWRDDAATADVTMWPLTCAAVEQLVMYKIYGAAFQLTVDTAKDAHLSDRLRSLAFLTPQHLDVATVDHADWSNAEAQLKALHSIRCPSGKMQCILQCYRCIMTQLGAASTTTATAAAAIADNSSDTSTDVSNVTMPGADELLPAMILLVKTVNPVQLHSNLAYMHAFAAADTVKSGEVGYAITQLTSAIQFLEAVDATSLSITADEFQQGIDSCSEHAHTNDDSVTNGLDSAQQNDNSGATAVDSSSSDTAADSSDADVSIRQISAMRRGLQYHHDILSST